MKLSQSLLLTSVGLSAVASAAPTVSYYGRNLQTTELLQERDFYPFDVLVERDFYEDDMLEAREFFFDDNMVETREYELEGRDYSNLDERGAVDIAIDVAKGIAKIVDIIKGEVAQDKAKRSQFTQNLVQKFVKQYPRFNIVVCHTKHTKQFDGKENIDWGHQHQEFDVKIGGTVGYEIYWFKSGWFDRQGDGGYLNWAFQGSVTKSERGGAKLTFKSP